MNTNGLKVVGVRIHNLKNIEFVDVALDEHFNIIAGNNGAGKSTLAESIFYALLGQKQMGKSKESLIKEGAEKAQITVKMRGEDEEIVIERNITPKTVTIKASSTKGRSIDQEFLDSLFSKFTIDPVAFMRMRPQEQIDIIKQIAGINTDEIDEKYTALYNERTLVNRNEKELKVMLDKIDPVKPTQKPDMQAMLAEKKEIDDHNQKVTEAEAEIARIKNRCQTTEKSIDDDERIIEEAQQRIAEKKAKMQQGFEKIDELTANIPARKDSTAIDEKISNANEQYQLAVKYEERKVIEDKYKATTDAQTSIETQMTQLMNQKKEMIANGNYPVENLTFDDEKGLLVSGIPFSQKSSAEQLSIACKIATVINPELKLIYIKDGSLLDSDHMKELERMSIDEDYTFLVEVVGEKTEGDNVILMRAGERIV